MRNFRSRFNLKAYSVQVGLADPAQKESLEQLNNDSSDVAPHLRASFGRGPVAATQAVESRIVLVSTGRVV